MEDRTFKVLVLGSHPISGFSMLNFTRDSFEVLSNTDSAIDFILLRPQNFFSKFFSWCLPKKLSVYLDKFLLFGPYIRWICIQKKPQIVHVLDHSDSTYKFFLPSWVIFVVTVHDLFAIEAAIGKIPEVETRLTGRIYQQLIKLGIQKADMALAISVTTQTSLTELFPNLKSLVVHNFIIPRGFETSILTEFSQEKYFLILMNSHWRKDRLNSILIWMKLSQEREFENSSLIIVGNSLTFQEKKLVGDKNLQKIKVFESLTRLEIYNLYLNAIAVINISKYEGFGMPIIEANSMKKICIFGGSRAFLEIAPPQNFCWSLNGDNILGELVQKIQSKKNVEDAYSFVLSNYSGELYARKVLDSYRKLF